MTTLPFRSLAAVSALLCAFLASSCNEGDSAQAEKAPAAKRVPSPKKVEVGPDGLARLIGETEPYSGAVMISDESGTRMRYFAQYQAGKLHGPEIRYFDDGSIRRQIDYQKGQKVYHREWFPNGNLQRDATFVDGNAIGPHRTFFEDGRVRWSGNFIENLLWQGHIIDYAEDGTLMWDAIFDKGKYVSGTYPESEQEKMISRGLVKPEEALYPRKPAAEPAPADPAAPPK
jgi:hypothetical protein